MKKLIKIGIIAGLIIGALNIPWMTQSKLSHHFSIASSLHMDFCEKQFLTLDSIRYNINKNFKLIKFEIENYKNIGSDSYYVEKMDILK
ncbi:MAG: hypothetical protein LIR50_12800 [Bacillota bacterium]|nr:hypothetical protein [Bacillota bacterium]